MNVINKTILQGDALYKLKEIEDNSIDLMVTDPPYGYSIMNKNWDKAIISVYIWKECLKVLKPGAFAFVMSAPRQDVLSHMIVNLTNAGFKTDFTSMYWAYTTGFPKARNISKNIDKKLKQKRKVIGIKKHSTNFEKALENKTGYLQDEANQNNTKCFGYGDEQITIPSSHQAKKLDGSYAGFQPKPAVEVILVCMKPLSEKNYTEQAMNNQKGVTWFDDCRIPYQNDNDLEGATFGNNKTLLTDKCPDYGKYEYTPQINIKANSKGRFPANLIVSDNAVDTGNFSRYFDLDAWEAQFIITPKPSKSEKNKGLDNFTEHKVNDSRTIKNDTVFQRGKTPRQNTHPTVKPVSLFKYLITMGSRENDLILDPFMGSGTTAIACEQIARDWIGIEKIPEYVEIFKARLNNYKKQQKMEEFVS